MGHTTDKKWRLTAITGIPKIVVSGESPEFGSLLPKSLHFESRITSKSSSVVPGLGTVILMPSTYTSYRPPADHIDLVVISFCIKATTPEMAISKVESDFELLLDDISFQIQYAARVFMLEVLDVTEPLEVGEDREVLLYPFPIGWSYPKFNESQFPSASQTAIVPTLRILENLKECRVRAALRWYVKALATPFDVDRFAFLWIALEILSTLSDLIIQKPYIAPCKHEIPSCPQCGESTFKKVQGPTLKEFLETIGVPQAEAKRLWETRQMFHGSNDLTHDALGGLPKLLILLKAAVAAHIKHIANLASIEFPIVYSNVVGLGKEIALGGTRKLESTDIE